MTNEAAASELATLRCNWLYRDIGTIAGFLSAEECSAWIARAEAQSFEAAPVTTDRGPVMIPDVRNNDRVMIDDPADAAQLYARAQPLLPPRVEKKWRPIGLNERLRLYRYDEGQQFDWHSDGYFERPRLGPGAGQRSFFTFMVYLNDGFDGGETLFDDLYDLPSGLDLLTVAPRQGMALIFRHPLLHKGEAVRRGRKYVLRTDVMYDRVVSLVVGNG